MCGIVGCVCCNDAENVLLSGLKSLEYRGYDSAGLALSNGHEIRVYKASGKLENLAKLLKEQNKKTNCGKGIGHIRWATHGKPTVENAHPHLSNDGKLALVHNGIIENYTSLKSALKEKGYIFNSSTDTETAVHLIDDFYKNCHDLEKAVIAAVQKLEGAFAFCLMHQDEPDKLIAVRKSAPLILGHGANGNYVASDVPALIDKANEIICLDDNEIAVITLNKISVTDFNGVAKIKHSQPLNLQTESIDKHGYKHYMLKEIFEQPDILRRHCGANLNKDILNPIKMAEILSGIRKFEIVACGTSLHAAMVAKNMIEQLCRFPVEVTAAGEYIYKQNLTDSSTLTLGISQSGETADTLTALKQARQAGAKILAVTNRPNSNIIRIADYVLNLDAGIEISVAATKSYLSQLMVLYLFSIAAAISLKTISDDEATHLRQALAMIPTKMETVLSRADDIQRVAQKYAPYKNFVYMARGLNLATAHEGALKLKEISYINACAYSAGELKHGPIALLDENMPVMALAVPETPTYAKMISNCEEAKARHARIICVTGENCQTDPEIFDDVITVPATDEKLTPLLYTVPMQLFAYYVADFLGQEVDQPRNLAKSVTVE